jgi:hypothetical protein
VRVLLVSTYELGHQPLHVASPAGALRRAGHQVRCTDLAVETLDPDALSWAEAVALSAPMHTAMRMALAVARSLGQTHPALPVALYGLYATTTAAAVDLAVAGEYEPELVAWVDGLTAGSGCGGVRSVALGRGRAGLPARDLLPPLDRYARLAMDGELHLAGYVEASHGCNHRCRHCPVPVVYDGRTRLVGTDALLADVAQLVALGARHLTFGDPDFLSGPAHARRVVDAVHGAFPDLTFDATVKVEHVLRHRDLVGHLGASGCLFVVSAFESADDATLAVLDKGHTVADELEAVAVLRAAGIEPRPSLLPFTPWTRAHHLIDLLDLVARADLVGNVDAVHYSIRLLLPPGSLLLGRDEVAAAVEEYDDERLGWAWRAPDPRLDELQGRLAALAEAAGARGWSDEETYAEVRRAVGTALALGTGLHPAPDPLPDLRSTRHPADRPRLTETWFCCAEPTAIQRDAVGLVAAAGDH